VTSTTRRATPRSRFHQLTDEPIEHDGERFKIAAPSDYAFEGFFVADNGERTNAITFDMTFREMTDGVLQSVPANSHRYYNRAPTLEELVFKVQPRYLRFYDPYDHEQGDPKPFEAIFRAHVFRLVKGWKHEQSLHKYLEAHPWLAQQLGFDEIPDQSTLWRGWENRLRDLHEAVHTAAEVVIETARAHEIPAPEKEFLPDKPTEAVTTSKSKDTLTREKSREVWRGAKPIVMDCFELSRNENAYIPEGAFWEQHAYFGMRSDLHPNDGAGNFGQETSRELTPCGDHHRGQTAAIGVERVRTMLRETARTLFARAKSRHDLDRGVTLAADITKGAPWAGHVERDSGGKNQEPWILGYKGEDGPFFQWAVIKIVGFDVPLILDAVPVYRGYKREEIVDDLLDGATDIVSNIDLLLMDREFCPDGVKDVCESHDVPYLNPAIVSSNNEHGEHIAKMERRDEEFDITEQRRIGGGESRKCLYLPKREYDEDGDDSDEDAEENTQRQELLEEFQASTGIADAADEESDRMFDGVLSDIEEDEELEERPGADAPLIVFETNHELVDADVDDEIENKHQIGRMMARYKRRWGIENAFKKVKMFLGETQSPDHRYRYFNFAFACVLYNCWRLVDILVQLEMGEEVGGKPTVTSASFLTLAKQYFGLDPPD
jgi:putative transposase